MIILYSSNFSRFLAGFLSVVIFSIALMGCGGGGGGGEAPETGGLVSGTSEGIKLLKITYPTSTGLTGGSEEPPIAAPLSQQIVLTFSGNVEGPVTSSGVQINATPELDYNGPKVALDKTKNLIVARGDYEILGNLIVFTPYMPITNLNLESPEALPESVPGLLPGYEYSIYIPISTPGAIPNVVKIEESNPYLKDPKFTTIAKEGMENLYFANHPAIPPEIESTDPADGSVDFSINTYSVITGFPENRDIIVELDQPLFYKGTNITGTDLDGDEFIDPNFYLRYTEPDMYSAVDRSQAQLGYIAKLNADTDKFELVGFTNSEGLNIGIQSIVFPRAGTGQELFKMVGCSGSTLYDINYDLPSGAPLVCGMTNERALSSGSDVIGLTLTREGDVYGLDRADNSLLLIDTSDGSVTNKGAISSTMGEIVDLCLGFDNELYSLSVQNSGTTSAVGAINKIDRDNLTTQNVVSGIQGDFTSIGFLRCGDASLFDASTLQRVVVEISSGVVIEYGLKINNPNLLPGSRLDFELKSYEIDVDAKLENNTRHGSTVRITPSGILPFGRWLDVMIRFSLLNLTRTAKSSSIANGGLEYSALGAESAACIRTFDPGSATIEDSIFEDFMDNNLEFLDHEYANAKAVWNYNDTNQLPPYYEHLLAGFGLAGNGELGDFKPLGIFKNVILDTDYQTLPLYDGSTPDVKSPVIVQDGEFNFHDIIIPDGVTVYASGSNPIILNATGYVLIDGIINVAGLNGITDTTFNSAFVPTPGGRGGPGAGYGGMSQPPIPPDFSALNKLQAPPSGETGWGPGDLFQIGGQGGDSGAKGTTVPWGGSSVDKNSRGAGGGGGTFLQLGREGYPGLGMYGVDIDGVYFPRTAWAYWDGSYKYDSSWNPGPPPDPIPEFWKINKWTAEKHPHPGGPGARVFTDKLPNEDYNTANDFIGPNGELKKLQGGQGGGGGGSRLDSMNPGTINAGAGSNPPLSRSAFDSKGGGGGGGGGAIAINSLGEILITKSGAILAYGGRGGGGEVIGHSNFGGGGGGGSGGCVILNSATRIEIEDTGNNTNYGRIDVSGGWGNDAKVQPNVTYSEVKNTCNIATNGKLLSNLEQMKLCSWSLGDGGYGGHGLIQLMVPDPLQAGQLVYNDISIRADLCLTDSLPDKQKQTNSFYSTAPNKFPKFSYYTFYLGGTAPPYKQVWPSTTDNVIPPPKTISTINPLSYAVSKWINMGQAVMRPAVGGLNAPAFQAFEGTIEDSNWSVVNTSSSGIIIDWYVKGKNDIEVDAPDLMKQNFIPNDNEVAIQFQGTDAVFPGSKVPNEDLSVMSDWTWDLESLSGKQFLRFKVRMNVSKGLGNVSPDNSKPQVNSVRLRLHY